ASEVVFRSLGKVGFSLYASRRYIAEHGRPERGKGLAGHQLITFTGVPGAPPVPRGRPAATSTFFLGESMENARTAMQCDNPLIQMQAAREGIGIAELACFLGDQSELVRSGPSGCSCIRTCGVQPVSNSSLPQSWIRLAAMPRFCATVSANLPSSATPAPRTVNSDAVC